MKKGRTLSEVLKEIEEISTTKADFIVNTPAISLVDNRLQFPDQTQYDITEIAHGQIAGALGIPVKYYNRMRDESPALLQTNVNHWFTNKPTNRLVRTLGTRARAFLSDRYRRLDNEDLAGALLPILDGMPGLKIESCEVTESRFYVKAVTQKLEGEISKGDVVYGGVVLSNSEVGQGSLRIEPMIYRLVCLNGLIMPDYGLRKFHIGRVQETEEFIARLSDEALEADDKAFWLKARDILKSTLSEDVFRTIVSTMQEATQETIPDPIHTVEKLSKKIGFSADEQKLVLTHLLADEDSTRYGLCNAITRASQDIENYDRATEFEYMGANVLLMPKADWRDITWKPMKRGA